MKGCLVDKVLKCAVEKEAGKRRTVEDWRVLLDGVLEKGSQLGKG